MTIGYFMQSVAIMATYPARQGTLSAAAASIAAQVDQLHIILNEYDARPPAELFPSNVRLSVPDRDLKDLGKFSIQPRAEDICFLCDDDIIYPADYTKTLIGSLNNYKEYDAVVGIHGVIYSDFFDGLPSSRIVHVFTRRLDQDIRVNQLGTGTVACFGRQMPTFAFMEGSERFVDVRFAAHCLRQCYPMMCLARAEGWLTAQSTGPSLFETFTSHWPSSVSREAAGLGGSRQLGPLAPAVAQHARS